MPKPEVRSRSKQRRGARARQDEKSCFRAGRTPAEDVHVDYAARWEALACRRQRYLYVLTRGDTDTGALRAYHVRSRELGPVLFQCPDGEITHLEMSMTAATLRSALLHDRPHYHWFDPRANTCRPHR